MHFIKKRKKQKRYKTNTLQLLQEPSIIDSIDDFLYKEDKDLNKIIGLVALDENDIIKIDRDIGFKNYKQGYCVYKYNEKTYNILKEVYPNKTIMCIHISFFDTALLNMDSYESVKNTYELLCATGFKPKDDKELVEYAIKRLIPNKKIIKTHKYIGKKAFENSKIRQYRLEYLKCYTNYIIEKLEEVKISSNGELVNT